MTDDLTGIVRSIRVAAALNDRVGVLLAPREFEEGDELSTWIGELGQIYPEVWSHLDDARRQLVARGMDVGAYDALRATPAANAPGVLQVDVTENLGGGAYKAAHLNHEGHAMASEACHVLRAALPEVDWVELDRAEAAELAAFGSLGPAMWKKVVFKVIAFGLLGGAIAFYVLMRVAG